MKNSDNTKYLQYISNIELILLKQIQSIEIRYNIVPRRHY